MILYFYFTLNPILYSMYITKLESSLLLKGGDRSEAANASPGLMVLVADQDGLDPALSVPLNVQDERQWPSESLVELVLDQDKGPWL